MVTEKVAVPEVEWLPDEEPQEPCACGWLDYDWTDPFVVANHRRRHDEWENGVRLRGLQQSLVGQGVVWVRSPMHPSVMRLMQRTGRYFQREGRYDFNCWPFRFEYDDVRKYHTRAVLAVAEDRVIGLAVVRDRWPVYVWPLVGRYGDKLDKADGILEPSPCIDAIWVARSHRRQGIARCLVQAATTAAEGSMAGPVWGTPFSESGRRLAEALVVGESLLVT